MVGTPAAPEGPPADCSDSSGCRGRRGPERVCRSPLGPGRPQSSRRLLGRDRCDRVCRPAESVTAATFAFVAADIARRCALPRQLTQLPNASRRGYGWAGSPIARRGSTSAGRPGRWSGSRRSTCSTAASLARDLRRVKVVVIGVIARGPHRPNRPEARLHARHDRCFVRPSTAAPACPLQRCTPTPWTRCCGARRCATPPGSSTSSPFSCWPASRPWPGSAGRELVAAAAIAATAVIFLAVAQLAFHGGWIVAVVVPLAALAASALGVAALAAGRVARNRAARRGSAPDDGLSPV